MAYGSESSDAGWAERTAGGLMAMDTVGEATLRDFEKRLYKVAEVVPLGYVDAKGFHKPKSLPAQFAAVSAPNADLAFLRERMGDVEVGRLRSGEDTIDLPVGIQGETLPSHVGVFATTGMGKSNLMKVLAGQLLAARAAMPCCCSTPTASTWRAGRPAGAAWPTTPGRNSACGSTRPAPGRPGQPAAAVAGRADRGRPAHRLEVHRPPVEALESAYALLGDKGVWLTRLAEEDPEVLKDAELGRRPGHARCCPGGPSGSCACR